MMKKKLIISLAVALMASTVCSAQISKYEYGANLVVANFDGFANNFATYTSGTTVFAKTDVTSKDGDYSGKISCTDFSMGASVQLHTQINIDYNLKNNSIIARLYVKGIEKTSKGLTYSIIFKNSANATVTPKEAPVFTVDDADADGWHRVWTVIEPDGSDIASVTLVCGYKAYPNDRPDCLYIDSMSLKIIPCKISTDDIVSEEKTVKLDDINLFGYDFNGEKKPIYIKQPVKYTVTGGNAHIDKYRNLIFDGADAQTVTVEADYYGVKTDFSVEFAGTSKAYITENEGVYTANVSNFSSENKNYNVYICIFDGEKLFDVKTGSISVDAYSSIEEPIDIPLILPCVKNPNIKVFISEH